MNFIATKMRELKPPNWFQGSALYSLSEPVGLIAGGYATDTRYVIVAFSPKCVDHKRPETTIFAANADGELFGNFWDRDSADPEEHIFFTRLNMKTAEFKYCRVVGENNHKKALEKLGYNYETVS